jgi:hypothetical protein
MQVRTVDETRQPFGSQTLAADERARIKPAEVTK